MAYSDDNSFEQILERALNNDVLINMDKREGSIIYDALAPICLELADLYVKMDVLEEQTYLMTATGSNLDKRCYDYGLVREEATKALRIATFKKYELNEDGEVIYINPSTNDIYDYYRWADGTIKYFDNEGNDKDIYGNRRTALNGTPQVDTSTVCTRETGVAKLVPMEITVGTRFAYADDDSITYEYIGEYDNQYSVIECEQSGTIGNSPYGTLFPLSPVANLIEAKITSTYTPAQDDETDEEFRERVQEHLNYQAFGGNIPDYIEKINAMEGVGNCKIFPAWVYNGSVLVSVVDSNFNPVTSEFKNQIKEKLDPTESTGEGIGLAPIGHFVTVTTPTEKDVTISLSFEYDLNYEEGEIIDKIKVVIQNYINDIRKQFAQDITLAVYRARISEKILSQVTEVVNVTDVLINDLDNDVIYNDIAELNKQYLPKLKKLVLNDEEISYE